MIVDSSAVLAIIQGEPEAAECAARLLAQPCKMSAANWVEAGVVIDNRSIDAQRDFEELIDLAGIEIVPVDEAQARIARDAYRRYGRGTGHRARLNFGDCFAYALAVSRGEPLLFVGDDFTETDVRPAIAG
ncbi:type II toxin-antitoxin system VapC family toxin [Microbacterium sp. XT11]|uniref:type II toxin-antitoxin system VapC family toxin n=1 Tax=Microbacterium sp. XT11 TaxID=367477 RepID=UPI000742FE12|nr:type II toxin-antitoxin system VapC family toxin [Microbacterium sp. XT11]ALX65726.1 ribonuclease [Microbacterium sp. XT11]